LTRWIVLFRGVNVGGHHKLPMAALRKALSEAGFEQMQSYIQSGNVALGSQLDADAAGRIVRAVVLRDFGFEPDILLIDAATLQAALDAAPFAPETDLSRAHLFFHLDAAAPAEIGDLAPGPGDSARLAAGAIAHYLETPDGVSNSRLAELLSRRLKDNATARNLRTCRKLLELAGT